MSIAGETAVEGQDSGADPSAELWSGSAESDHADIVREARELIAAERLSKPAGKTATIHLVLEWGLAVAVAIGAHLLDSWPAWIVSWFILAWVFAGNAGITHEAVHGHLFRSKRANRFFGTAAMGMLFFSFATYRAFHWQHHARTAVPGDPERTPLSFHSRLPYVATLLVGGLGVLVENIVFTIMTVVGRAPKWAQARRHRRAIALNALVTAATVGGAVWALEVAPRVTLEVWLIPAGIAMLIILPLLLVTEHYGASGFGDILSNTRSVQSNRLLRWFFWNTNLHAAHHLAPSVPFSEITRIDEIIGRGGVDAKFRVSSYSAFHWGNITRFAYSRDDGAPTAFDVP